MEKILNNTRWLVLIISLIIIAGFSAISTLPRAEDPALTNRWATITTQYPGANAERVETLITEVIETQLRTVAEIALIESQSKPNVSIINIELQDTLQANDAIWAKIRDKLEHATTLLPDSAQAPQFDNDNNDAFSYITALTWQANSPPDRSALRRYAKELANQWRNIAGTEFVDIKGEMQEEVLVSIDQTKASALGLTALEVSTAIANHDAKNPAGELINAQTRFQVEVAGAFKNISQVANAPLIITADGVDVRVQDVAYIEKTTKTPAQAIAVYQDKPAVYISARMENSHRIDRWSAATETWLTAFQATLPQQIKLQTVFTQNKYTATRLDELMQNLMFGFVIVLSVLFLTLGARSALLVALSLPITTCFTLAMMKFTGLPINQMSITGLIVSLGVVVDNAIVMVDTIAKFQRQGKQKIQAALEAIRHLWVPLLGSTLTTILAFAPIFLMPGPAGEFVGAIAITVCFSLIGSYFVSHVLIAPFACKWLSAANQTKWYQTGLRLPQLSHFFTQTVSFAPKHPWKTIGLIVLLPVAGMALSLRLTAQFFPPSDRDMFEIQVLLAPNASIDASAHAVQKINALLKTYPEIEAVGWVIGQHFPSFYYNLIARHQNSPYFAQAMIKTNTFQAANHLIPKLQQRLSHALPEVQILVRKLEQGPPVNAPLEVRIFGHDLDQLAAISEQIRAKVAKTANVIATRETLQPSIPNVKTVLNPQASLLAGYTPNDIANLLQLSLIGQVQGSIEEMTESIPIRVRIANDARQTPSDLAALYLPVKVNQQQRAHSEPLLPPHISLATLAQFEIEPTRSAITRRNGERVNTIEGYLAADVLAQTALETFTRELEHLKLQLPAGYRIEFGGESAERSESVNQLLANMTMAITLLIAVVILTFNSFRLSNIIFLVAAQAAALGLFCVWLLGYPFGFTVIIGLLGLVGLAVNDAIVILTELKASKAAMTGNSQAITFAVSQCSRHVWSTTITTVGGFLPLILAGGGFWPPFAITIAGGTLFTTLLSLYFVPAAFTLYVRSCGQLKVTA